ncbi:hypothetical protein QFZ98_004503 [Paraburkholderia youngii]
MLEVSPDAFGLLLNDQIMVRGGLGQLQPGTRWRPAGDALLEVGVGHLVGIQLGAVAGQIEHLDPVAVPAQLGLHGLAVMDTQIVQDQEDLFLRPGDQPSHEVDQDGFVRRFCPDGYKFPCYGRDYAFLTQTGLPKAFHRLSRLAMITPSPSCDASSCVSRRSPIQRLMREICASTSERTP